MKKVILTSAITLLFGLVGLFAQTGSLTGVVQDASSGETLPGVNVLVVELNRGTATNLDGEYTIDDLPYGQYNVTVSFVGYQTIRRSVTINSPSTTVNFNMDISLIDLEDVVVTAFGLERSARALGYGVSEVSADKLENRIESDVVRSLTGKLPGVKIENTSGVTGTGTNFIIRGYTSISGSNQPLFIVDGVRFDGSDNASSGFAVGGGSVSNPNRFLDIDPKNIESVSVLRGLSATTVYGEQGRNGVVLITTKSGSFAKDAQPGFEVTFDQGFHATSIASQPDYQDTYGVGFDQQFGWFFSNWGPRFDSTDPGRFGVQFRGQDSEGNIYVQHPTQSNATARDAFPEFSLPENPDGTFEIFDDNGNLLPGAYRYEAKPDPMDAFFRTGYGATTSLNISGGTEAARVNVSYSRNSEDGFTPGNNLTRNAFGIGSSYQITPRLRGTTSFNFALTQMATPPLAAGGGSGPAAVGGTTSVFADVFYTPRSIDLEGIPYQNPVTGANVYYRGGNDIPHPLWTANNIKLTNDTDRYFGRTELNYNVMDGLNVIYRVGYDNYTETQEYRQNRGGIDPEELVTGFYQTIKNSNTIWDHNVNVLYDRDLTEDISFSGLGGFQFVESEFTRDGIDSQNQIIFDFFQHSNNFTENSATNFFTGGNHQAKSKRQTAGVFADLTFGYRDYVYLNVSGRNDWFSTLEVDNRSIFYPAGSISFIASDALDITSDVLTYLKIYAGVGTSAGSPGVYSTRSTLGSNARAFIDAEGSVVTTNFTSSFLGNPNLKPELHTEFELGVETRLFENRITLNTTYYNRVITDLITNAPIDPSTGFTSTLINIGEIENNGLEVSLSGTPLRGDLQWDVDTNFFTDATVVNKLGGGLDEVQVGGGFTTRGNFAVPGEPFLIMKGSVVVRDENGNPVVDDNGTYLADSDIGFIGNPNPQFTLGFTNTFRYQGFTFSFQFDYQHGGDIFSTWISTLLSRGLTTDTDRVNRDNTFIVPGVREDGTPNNTMISVSSVFFDNFGFGTDELRVYDATHIRLSELALSYDIPVSLVNQTPFKQVTLTLVGNNLWFFAPNVPEGSGFDPNVNSLGVGNNRGFEYLTGPSARRLAANIRVRF